MEIGDQVVEEEDGTVVRADGAEVVIEIYTTRRTAATVMSNRRWWSISDPRPHQTGRIDTSTVGADPAFNVYR